MNVYLRACLRFWWLLLIGIGAALAVGMIVEKRHKPTTYYSYAQLMVDSPARPFLRTNVVTVQPQPPKAQVARVQVPSSTTSSSRTRPPSVSKTEVVTVPQPPQVRNEVPVTSILVQAANVYPVLVQSDAVTAMRRKLFGRLPGSVSAEALFVTSTPNRFRPSSFPIIQINAFSTTPANAKRLASSTGTAFRRWLVLSQNASGVPPKERIIVRPLVTPHTVIPQTHSNLGLGVIVGLALLAGFAGLAAGVDRLVPGRSEEEERASLKGAPGEATTVSASPDARA